MSGLNHKGPVGAGPMTGRKMGKCTHFGARQRNEEQVITAHNSTNEQTQSKVENTSGGNVGRGQGAMGRGQGAMGQGLEQGQGAMGRGQGAMGRGHVTLGRGRDCGRNGNGSGMGRRLGNRFGNENN